MTSLNKDVQGRIAAKYDTVLEANIKGWIEQETGESFNASFADALKDGILLCKLINKLKPGTISTIHTSRMPFKQMENINNFLAACCSMGLLGQQVFQTVDLYEQKNLTQVLQCLYTLSKVVGKDIGGDGSASGGGVGFDFSMFQNKSN